MKKIILILIIMLMISFITACNDNLTNNEMEDYESNQDQDLNDYTFDRLFLGYNKKIITIEITKDEYKKLDEKMLEYYNEFGTYRSNFYIKSNVIFKDDDGEIYVKNVGFRTRGNLSRKRIVDENGDIVINHYKLKFNENFDEELNNSNRFMFGLEELDLKYNRNFDETYMNEYYSLRLYNEYGVFAQKSTLVIVQLKIDDIVHKMGIYTAFEPIDELFIRKRFDNSNLIGDLYKSLWQQFGPALLVLPENLEAIGIKKVNINYRPAYDLKTNKSTSSHEALLYLLESMKKEYNHRKIFLEAYFDFDYMAKYFAISLLLGNPDDFRSNANNYYIYFEPLSEKYYIIPYDLDHSLGQGWDGSPVYENQLVNTPIYDYPEFFDYALGVDLNIPFIETLMSIKEFQELYEKYLIEIATSKSFDFDTIRIIIDEFQESYGDEVDNLMLNLDFGYRDLENYLKSKKESVLEQLNSLY